MVLSTNQMFGLTSLSSYLVLYHLYFTLLQHHPHMLPDQSINKYFLPYYVSLIHFLFLVDVT